MSRKQLDAADRYFDLRTANKIEEIFDYDLFTNDIVIDSFRDGIKTCKEEVKTYLTSTQPRGTWQKAEVDTDGKVVIKGNVWMIITINIIARFYFNENGRGNKISRIELRKN